MGNTFPTSGKLISHQWERPFSLVGKVFYYNSSCISTCSSSKKRMTTLGCYSHSIVAGGLEEMS